MKKGTSLPNQKIEKIFSPLPPSVPQKRSNTMEDLPTQNERHPEGSSAKSLLVSLPELLSLAQAHPFYQSDLLTSTTPSLSDFPIMEKPQLHKKLEECGAKVAGFLQGVYLSPSGGSSSGIPLFFVTDVKDNWRQRTEFARTLEHLGIFGKETTASILFSGNLLYRSLEIFVDFVERCGGTPLALGSVSPDAQIVSLSQQFKATMIAGSTNRLIQLAIYVEKEKIPLKFNGLIYAGEEMHPGRLEYLKRVLGVEKVSSIYGSAESGIWAVKHFDLPLGQFLFDPALMHVEIIDPDSEGFGRIVVTNLCRRKNPLVRYDMGDIGRLRDSEFKSQQGQPLRILHLKGRSPASFSVSDNYYSLEEFQSVIDKVLDFQVVIDYDPENKAVDTITFNLVLDLEGNTDSKVLDGLHQEILSILDFSVYVKVSVNNIPPASLIRIPGSQKVKRVVDRR